MQQIWTQIINRMNFPITEGSLENCHIEAIDFWSKRKAKSFPDNLPLHQVQLVIQPAPVAALPLQPLRVLRLLRSRSGQVAAPRQRWNKRQGCQNWVRTRTPKFLAWIKWESTALEKATGKLDEWVKTSSLPLVCQYVDSSVRLARSLLVVCFTRFTNSRCRIFLNLKMTRWHISPHLHQKILIMPASLKPSDDGDPKPMEFPTLGCPEKVSTELPLGERHISGHFCGRYFSLKYFQILLQCLGTNGYKTKKQPVFDW